MIYTKLISSLNIGREVVRLDGYGDFSLFIPADVNNSLYQQYLFFLNEATPEELEEANVTFGEDEILG